MNRRFEITDEEWERLAPLLPATTPQRGGRWRDHRQVLNGILFRVRSGIPWRDLPERYGPWETVYKRFARWQTDGVAQRGTQLRRLKGDRQLPRFVAALTRHLVAVPPAWDAARVA